MKHAINEYPVTVRWIGEREGVLESVDDLPPLAVSSPPQFGGAPGVWSPEHMLVAATAACLMSTFLAIAAASDLRVLSFEAPAQGTLSRGEDGRYRLSRVVLRPRLALTREADRERAVRILARAHEACLVTRSLNAEVAIEPVLEIAYPEPVAL